MFMLQRHEWASIKENEKKKSTIMRKQNTIHSVAFNSIADQMQITLWICKSIATNLFLQNDHNC